MSIGITPPGYVWAYRLAFAPALPLSMVIPFTVLPVDYDRIVTVASYNQPTEVAQVPRAMSDSYTQIPQEQVPQRAGDTADVFMLINVPSGIRSGFWQFGIRISEGSGGIYGWFGYLIPGVEWDNGLAEFHLSKGPIEYDGGKFINRFTWIDRPGVNNAIIGCQLYRDSGLIFEDSWSGDAHGVVTKEIRPDYRTTENWDWGYLEVSFPVGSLPDGEYTYKATCDFGVWGILGCEWEFLIASGSVVSAPGNPIFTPDPWRMPKTTLPWRQVPTHPAPYLLEQRLPEYYEPNIEFTIGCSFANLGKGAPGFVRLIDSGRGSIVASEELNLYAGVTYDINHSLVKVVYEGETPPQVIKYNCKIGHYEGDSEVVDLSWDVRIPLQGYELPPEKGNILPALIAGAGLGLIVVTGLIVKRKNR